MNWLLASRVPLRPEMYGRFGYSYECANVMFPTCTSRVVINHTSTSRSASYMDKYSTDASINNNQQES